MKPTRPHRTAHTVALAACACALAGTCGTAAALTGSASPQVTTAAESSAAITALGTASTASATTAAASSSTSASEQVGATFTVDGLGYTVLTAASNGTAGTVKLSSVSPKLEQATVPATVTSPDSGATYQVTELAFAAFSGHEKLTSVDLPGTITSCVLDMQGACFSGCTVLKSIHVSGVTSASLLASADGVLYARSSGENVSVLRYPQAKADSSFAVPKSVSTVLAGAFKGNADLKNITFAAGLTGVASQANDLLFSGGIGASAFQDCTALEKVTFPNGAKVATASTSVTPAIGSSAFAGCTALESIDIPALTSAAAKANAYQTFAELNPNNSLNVGTSDEFTGGYMPYWHNDNGPVARPGIGGGAFEGCTSLKRVTFKAGWSPVSFAYWASGSSVFAGCTALKSLVYESTQAYWGDPNASMQNGSYVNIWDSDHNDVNAPTSYLAVDYYATESQANAADATDSTRLARVEYARGTSTSKIATSDASLASKTAERSTYAETAADGVIPDPNEAAKKAGLGSGTWVWHLTGTQSRRSGLAESCRAYLVKASSLDAARLGAPQTDALYLQTDRNLSQGTALAAGSAFDATRYSSDSTYTMTALSGEQTPYFTYNPTTKELDTALEVTGADGTVLDTKDYKVSYQHYDRTKKKLGTAASHVNAAGAWLVTVTPADGSSLSGTLTEWILVANRDGKLVESFGKTTAATEHGAKHAYSQTTPIDYSSAPYSITVGAKDVDGALVASAYAGLVHGALNVDTSATSKTYGFTLNRSTHPDGSVDDKTQSRSFKRTGSASTFAVAVYRHFADASNRATYKAPASTYPWGTTAILVPYGRSADVASASALAYGLKAPIFFAEKDGSVSKATLSCLKKFSKVLVCGNSTLYSDKAFKKLSSKLGHARTCTRIGASAKNSGDFSLAVARYLVGAGAAKPTVATVSDGTDPLDCILALDLSGHEGGITLVTKSTAQSKRIASYLHKNVDTLTLTVLFGRTGAKAPRLVSKNYSSSNALGAVWKSDATFSNVLAGVTTTARDTGFQPLSADKEKHGKATEATTHEHEHKHGSAANGSTRAHASAGGTSSSTSRAGSSSSSTDGGTQTTSSTTGSKDSGSSAATGAKHGATAQQVADAQPSQADDSTQSAQADTPWWLQIPFIIALIALAAFLIPFLRRCR